MKNTKCLLKYFVRFVTKRDYLYFSDLTSRFKQNTTQITFVWGFIFFTNAYQN